ncbi:unnamed protein product, partial [Ectocarpus sp. 13 AM-2016]
PDPRASNKNDYSSQPSQLRGKSVCKSAPNSSFFTIRSKTILRSILQPHKENASDKPSTRMREKATPLSRTCSQREVACQKLVDIGTGGESGVRRISNRRLSPTAQILTSVGWRTFDPSILTPSISEEKGRKCLQLRAVGTRITTLT